MNLRLVGLLDSPYVRRLAIALQLMELEFTHIPLSVFRTYYEFAQINPVVKAPTLICDDETVLMDSGLIVQFASVLSKNSWAILPNNRKHRAQRLRVEGLALAVLEKAVQHVYETQLRPNDKQHQPWRMRVAIQLTEALSLLNHDLKSSSWDFSVTQPNMAEVTAAVAWTFCLEMVPQLVEAEAFSTLDRLTKDAEQLPAFKRAPHSEHIYPYSEHSDEITTSASPT